MHEAVQFVLAILCLLYVTQSLLILLGTHRLNYSKRNHFPKISILVALRDEEATLEPCVESLLKLDYPKHAMEILLINDRSHDRTPSMIEEFKKRSSRIKTVHINHGIEGLSGKANAIAQGMEHSSGELVLVTDGDCRVPASWAKAHVAYYTKNVGLVGGFTLLDEKHDRTPLFGKIQTLDWTYLLSIGSGAIGLGVPLSVLGNNFSFRREAYRQVGGYREMGFTIIEDFALMRTLLKKTSWNVLYPIDPNMVVYSHPMANLEQFYHQRKRWSAGGKEVGLYGKFLMFVSHTVHVLLPISCFFLEWTYLVGALAALIISDFLLLWRTTAMVKRQDLLKYFAPWEAFYFAYTTVFAPVLLFPTTVTWKEISYSWKLNGKLKRMAERKRKHVDFEAWD
ncbi:glycosyltransferase [candidate division KSB1 bacterium]|nr:glycosyltransferase [candidate division KSB1 bacterium]NIR73269.1 glycosyltransferase [candidate division KSB1 bacterium]NIS26975.1 glycosyltransferase [candidate division KSB1 bacterium]NIT73814.1 glycosyltransferase [candidate division KSB1 bacterium]NIU27719.1 glycosyltransferase [candidate division KSB1 bacterium]